MAFEQIASITAFDEGWAVQWGERHFAVKTERDLARVVGRLGRELRIGCDGGSETVGRVIQFPTPTGDQPLHTLSPEVQREHALHNLTRLAEGWVSGVVDSELFESLLPGACPGVSGEDVQAALDRAQLKYGQAEVEDVDEGGGNAS